MNKHARDETETLGGDLERTEQASASEIEELVRASVAVDEAGGAPGSGRAIEDEDTATGDPDAIERAALASASADETPPSSDGTPVSLRDDEPISVRELEPVSLRDVELAMAPGKAPPRLPTRPPPRRPSVPTAPRPAPSAAAPSAATPTPARAPAPRGPRPPAADDTIQLVPRISRPVPHAPLKKRQPSLSDANVADPSPAATPPRRQGSSPPPLPPADRRDEVLSLSGGLEFGLAPPPVDRAPPPPPPDLAPATDPAEEAPPPSGLEAPEGDAAAPARTKKKRKNRPIAFDEPSAEDAPAAGATTTNPARRDDAASSDPPLASTRSTPAQVLATRRGRGVSAVPEAPPEASRRSKLTWIVGAAAIAAAAGYVAFGRDANPTHTEARSPEQHASAGATPTPAEAEPAPSPTEPAPVPPLAEDPVEGDDPTATPPATAPTAAPPAATVTTAPGPMPAAPAPSPVTAPAPSPGPAPADPAGAERATPPATADAPPPSTAEFDRSAASSALTAAMGSASGCKQPGDPSGVARVSVTFAPSGRVTQANVLGPPFAGTATGGCIARSFRSASVPPFAGGPVTVSKTVHVP